MTVEKVRERFLFLLKNNLKIETELIISILLLACLILGVFGILSYNQNISLQKNLQKTASQKSITEQKLQKINSQFTTLQNEDQYIKNKKLEKEIKDINKTYASAQKTYEKLQDYEALHKDNPKFDTLFAQSLNYLSQTNYASSQAVLTQLNTVIDVENKKYASSTTVTTTNVTQSNNPPGSGFSVQQVTTEVGAFTVDIIAADLSSTKVIVDTASDNDCTNNCPVLPLAAYVARSGAYAGINGSFFCPASYPSCAGKTNSFDLLVMNKDKHYFNSDNNVYSTNPAVIFGSGFIRFVGQASEWGRDTSVDGVLSNYPLLISGGNIVFSGSSDPKFGSRGARGFVAHKGNTVYIGDVNGATMSESAHVLKTLGMDDAINLDEGGSTALWYGGYKEGPGRDIPNAILFVKK